MRFIDFRRELEVGDVYQDDKMGFQTCAEGFWACLPSFGAKAKNDRLFLEALLIFTLHNISWRALPEQFGNWNNIWIRFDHLGKAGVLEDYLSILAGLDEGSRLIAMLNSTVIHAQFSSAGAKGGRKVMRWCGGFGTKIHLKTDQSGRPLGFKLTGGEAFDSNAIREATRMVGAVPVIPYKSNQRDIPRHFAEALNQGRTRIEQMMGKLNRYKRVALRCQKTARNFRSIIAIAAAFILIKFVHTA